MSATPSSRSKRAPSPSRQPLARPIEFLEFVARSAFGSRAPGMANRVQEALRRFHQGAAGEATFDDFLSDWESLEDLASGNSVLGLTLRPSLKASEVYAAVALLALEQARARIALLVAKTKTLIDVDLDRMLENAIWANTAAHDAAGTEREQRSNAKLAADREKRQRVAESQQKRELSRIRWRDRDEHERLAVQHSRSIQARSRAAAAFELVIWLERHHKMADGTPAVYNTDTLERWLKKAGWTKGKKGVSAS